MVRGMSKTNDDRQMITLKLPRETHKALKLIAINKGTTLQEMLGDAAEQIVARAEKAGAPR